jgi:hypothetical protein
MSNKAGNTDHSGGQVHPMVMPIRDWQQENKYKFSNIFWLKGDLQQCVLRAAMDWQKFQSAENTHALYMAVMAMQGIEPENIHLLDGVA